MTPEQRAEKIKILTYAKDHLEKGLAVLEAEGYNRYNDTYKAAVFSINTLKSDIIGLQTGIYPFMTVEEVA